MKRRRLNPLSCCGGGFVGSLLLIAIIFTVGYRLTGHYQPDIPPPRPLPAVNGYDDYVSAARLVGWNTPLNVDLQKPNFPILQRLLQQNSNALSIFRTGLTKDCVVRNVRDPWAEWPEFSGFRNLVRLIAAEEIIKSRRGDYAGAFESGLDGIQFSIEIARGGVSMHMLVAVGCQEVVERHMVAAIDHLTDAECDQGVARLTRILSRQTAESDILDEQRAFYMTGLSKVRDIKWFYNGEEPDDHWTRLFGGMEWHFARDRALQELSDYYRKAIAESKKPRSQRIDIPEPKSHFANMFAMGFTHIWDKYARMDVHNRLLLCMLAIRSYRLKHGRLPESLAALTLPDFATIDHCNGRPFIYLPEGSSYRLYSVGTDGKDDGGVPANEYGSNPVQGDMGVLRFAYWANDGAKQGSGYHRVPHMKPPVLPKGAPPLNQ